MTKQNYTINNSKNYDAMQVKLDNIFPKYPQFMDGIRRAPSRGFRLSKEQTKTALKNALRYIPEEHHALVADEFMQELVTYGRIYGYRYRPAERIYGKPIDEYVGACVEGKAFQVMIDNNLDFDTALYPYELVTYGETGRVFQNWMQYQLV
ncbi:MAG: urocanate hydratase, partial [Oscillospiraceae bacterium]|nr:urocanate hydratase [Oscillospiraceae bacterium]